LCQRVNMSFVWSGGFIFVPSFRLEPREASVSRPAGGETQKFRPSISSGLESTTGGVLIQ